MLSLVVAALLAAAPAADTVYTTDGGRITGTVLEESPTSGVTIQAPDGSIRRVAPGEVSRIEFADGTVSTRAPGPGTAPGPQAAPAPQAAPQPPTGGGPVDTVRLVGGGRARGNVIEENATTGVRLRRLDASIHVYPPEEVVRIEYADGTVSTPRSAPARTPAPAPAPSTSAGDGRVDTVYFLAGGRVRGTVIEEHPRNGVRIRLLDGTYQTYPRSDLVRIEYSDGSVSSRKLPASAPPAAAPSAPPVAPAPAAAPAPAPAVREAKPQLVPLYLSLGLGATFFGGDAEQDVRMKDVIGSDQGHVSGELGLRFTPHFALGVYGDVGANDPISSVREQCQTQGIDCTATAGRVGILARHTWDPLSTRPKWLSLGTGWEVGGVAIDRRDGSHDAELFKYTGREYVRVGAGIDFRSNQVLAFGLYGSFAVGEYDQREDSATAVSLQRSTHTTTQVGLRLTLFP